MINPYYKVYISNRDFHDFRDTDIPEYICILIAVFERDQRVCAESYVFTPNGLRDEEVSRHSYPVVDTEIDYAQLAESHEFRVSKVSAQHLHHRLLSERKRSGLFPQKQFNAAIQAFDRVSFAEVDINGLSLRAHIEDVSSFHFIIDQTQSDLVRSEITDFLKNLDQSRDMRNIRVS